MVASRSAGSTTVVHENSTGLSTTTYDMLPPPPSTLLRVRSHAPSLSSSSSDAAGSPSAQAPVAADASALSRQHTTTRVYADFVGRAAQDMRSAAQRITRDQICTTLAAHPTLPLCT
jgi:hypothetical protein